MAVTYEWRGPFNDIEVERLHAEAFGVRTFGEAERSWTVLVQNHSLGWVVARDGRNLVGFVNTIWDGRVHAWIQDTMVAVRARHQDIGTHLVAMARERARDAGCAWLHVDFDDPLMPFYLESCGFLPSSAGLIALRQAPT